MTPGGQYFGQEDRYLFCAGFQGPTDSKVLARYVLDQPAAVAKKKVLDLGSGCGAVSIAAKR